MPTITEETELSEVNLRFAGGVLVSREAWSRIIIKRDGEKVSETGAKADLTDEQLAAILGNQMASLTAQITSLQDDKAAALADKASAEAARDALQAQLDALQPPAPADPVVTSLQARIALKHAGLLSAVETLIASLPSDDDARIYWEYAVQFHRHNPVLTSVAAALQLSDEQVDQLFAAAQAID